MSLRYHTFKLTMTELNERTEINHESNIGIRFLAGFMDYLIIFTFFFVYVYSFGEPSAENGYTVNGLPALVPVLFWGIMTVGMEQVFGATLGNILMNLKPVSINGIDEKLSLSQSFIRHLLDPIDMFFFGLVGILIIKNSDKNQRVGDIAAKTIVVKQLIQKTKNGI